MAVPSRSNVNEEVFWCKIRGADLDKSSSKN